MSVMTSAPLLATGVGESLEAALGQVDDFLYTWILSIALVAVGLYLTVRTRGVQFRSARAMRESLRGSRDGQGGISSFQAFAVGIAARVGIGNIAGVSLALVGGGPGAIFWMWVVAALGMATAFVESTLAQIFKVRTTDGSFRGGPAYYMERGLGSRALGKIFAVMCVVSVGVTVVMVQSNSLAGLVVASVPSLQPWMIGLVLAVLTAPAVIGGLRSVARLAEWMAPVMATIYVLITFIVILTHLPQIPGMLASIVTGAFGADQALYGVAGGLTAAVINGVRRGLFSNEAGLGTAPNAAGTATVSHPAKQGFIQAFGVFVDTMVVCTCTGLLILLTTETYHPGEETAAGALLTQMAVAEHFGNWTTWPMVILIFVLVFSTIIGCYSYSIVNVDFLSHGARRSTAVGLGLIVVVAAFAGAVLSLPVVWALTDIALGVMGLLNIVVLLRLAPWAIAALRDYEQQRAQGKDPVFSTVDNPLLPGTLEGSVWTEQVSAR